MQNGTIDNLDTYLRFFPEAFERDFAYVPSRDEVIDTLREHGFELKKHGIIHQKFADNLKEYFEKIRFRGLSDLQMLTPEIY